MRIETVPPVPPQPSFSMTFTRDEGWAILAALTDYAGGHREAADRECWLGWAKTLDRELRRGL